MTALYLLVIALETLMVGLGIALVLAIGLVAWITA